MYQSKQKPHRLTTMGLLHSVGFADSRRILSIISSIVSVLTLSLPHTQHLEAQCS